MSIPPSYIIQDMNHMENDRENLLKLFSEPGLKGHIAVNQINRFIIRFDNDTGKLNRITLNKKNSFVKEFINLFDDEKVKFLQDIMNTCLLNRKRLNPALK